MSRTLAGLIALALCASVEARPPVERPHPKLRVIGTVQDGGLPHTACRCERCEWTRAAPERARYVASLALILPDADLAAPPKVFLVDCTPDLTEQLGLLGDTMRPAGQLSGPVDRSPIDGVFLTHAHIGHYLGLAHLGFEVVHTQGALTYCTPRMAEFLRTNGPWSQLVKFGNIEISELAPGATVEMEWGVRVTPIAVPHRDEFSDTVAFRFAGPERTVLYMPDTEPFERWPEAYGSLERILDDPEHPVDVFLVDATFYSLDELPNRHVSAIGHPLVVDTMDRLQDRVRSGDLEVWFTHLNHSNPALLPDSEELAEILRRGFRVAREMHEIGL